MIDEKTLREGLAATRWPCRIELLRRKPLIIADGAHDRDSARRLVQTLRDDLGLRDAMFVIGCSRDKDIDALAEEIAPIARTGCRDAIAQPALDASRARSRTRSATASVPVAMVRTPVASRRSMRALAQAGRRCVASRIAVRRRGGARARARRHVRSAARSARGERMTQDGNGRRRVVITGHGRHHAARAERRRALAEPRWPASPASAWCTQVDSTNYPVKIGGEVQ